MITGAISALPKPIQNYYPSTYITGGGSSGSTQGLADAVGRTTSALSTRIDNLLTSPSVSGLLSAVNGSFSGDLSVAGSLTVSGAQSLSGALGAAYFTASDASATSTFTRLTATRSDLGTVIAGTWQGSPIADAYITKTGDWTGTLSGHNGAYYLDARNLANFDTPFGSALTATTSLPNLTTLAGLTSIGASNSTTTFAGGLQAGGGSGLYLLQNGNVGIGTTSPSQKLDVNGGINVAGSITHTLDGDYGGGTLYSTVSQLYPGTVGYSQQVVEGSFFVPFTYEDMVMNFGYNYSGSAPIDATKAAQFLQFESAYQLNNSALASNKVTEFHLNNYDVNGVNHRAISVDSAWDGSFADVGLSGSTFVVTDLTGSNNRIKGNYRGAYTTLNGSINNSTTAIVVTSGASIANGNYITISAAGANTIETVLVAAGGGTVNLTVTRAQLGTAASEHSTGTIINLPNASLDLTSSLQVHTDAPTSLIVANTAGTVNYLVINTVSSAINTSLGITSAAQNGLVITNTANATSAIMLRANNGSKYASLGVDIGGSLALDNQAQGGSMYFRFGAGGVKFDNSSGNRVLTLTDAGNLGIGTTAPGKLLSLFKAGTTAATSPQILFTASTTAGSYAAFTNNWAMGVDLADGGKFKISSSTVIGTNDRLVIDGSGNVGIGTTTTLGPLTMNSGAYVTTGGVWTNASDRNSKENFATMTPADILTKINALPITEWNYKAEDPTVKHIGPVAQDFYALFGLGGPAGNTSISTIDPAGVALLGIQALSQRVDQLSSSTSRGIFIDKSSVMDTLGYFAGQVVDGVVHFGQVVVDKITATLGVFHQVRTDELCVGSTCVTETEFKALLDNNGISPAASVPTASPTVEMGTRTSTTSAEEDGETSGDTTGTADSNSLQEEDEASSTPASDPATPPAAESAVLPAPPADTTPPPEPETVTPPTELTPTQ